MRRHWTTSIVVASFTTPVWTVLTKTGLVQELVPLTFSQDKSIKTRARSFEQSVVSNNVVYEAAIHVGEGVIDFLSTEEDFSGVDSRVMINVSKMSGVGCIY